MAPFIQISTTTNTRANADKIARMLLQQRLAACVQIVGPIYSRFRWKGKLEHSNERLCLIKARSKDYSRIEQAIHRMHPYEVPEVIASPIIRGSAHTWNGCGTKPQRKVGKVSLQLQTDSRTWPACVHVSTVRRQMFQQLSRSLQLIQR